MEINGARLQRDLAELSKIGGRPDGGLDRIAWSPADLEARTWVRDRIEEIGWVAETDAALNIFGHSRQASKRRLLVGSHTDSVRAGGCLDGGYGVIAALEIVRTLIEYQDPVADAVEIVDFADEEGVGFPCGYFGSKALTGLLDPDELRRVGAEEVLAAAGVVLRDLRSAADRLETVAAYVELHIEQGPRLERENLEVAVASGILGFDRYEIVLTGRSDHGGTTPLDMRSDPVLAAGLLIAEIPSLIRTIDENGTATVGSIQAEGGAINIVARQVRLTLELRQPSSAALQRSLQLVRDRLESVCASTKCSASFEARSRVPEVRNGVTLAVEEAFAAPVAFDGRMVAACERACQEIGARYRLMPAGTWHDAGIMAGLRPSAMLLVPSRGGVTHCPEESTADEHLIAGANALLHAARQAASTLGLLSE